MYRYLIDISTRLHSRRICIVYIFICIVYIFGLAHFTTPTIISLILSLAAPFLLHMRVWWCLTHSSRVSVFS